VAILAEETGIAVATIYGWRQSARRKTFLAAAEPLGGRQVSVRKERVRSPSDKQKMVQESDSLRGDALVAYAREKGVTVPELMTWKDQMLGSLERREEKSKMVSAERYDQVLRELERKNEALAEAAALVFLAKKVSRVLGGEK
jgi:transposase-like protein